MRLRRAAPNVMFNMNSLKKMDKLNNFFPISTGFQNNFHLTESEERRMSGLLLTFKKICLLYTGRVGIKIMLLR
jgi:hypothetical protein